MKHFSNALERRIESFERQIFGQKSERRIVDTNAQVQLGPEEPAANIPDRAPTPKAPNVDPANSSTPRSSSRAEGDMASTHFDRFGQAGMQRSLRVHPFRSVTATRRGRKR